MKAPPRFLKGMIAASLVFCMLTPSAAQIEDQVSAYTGVNAKGYLKPLAQAFGTDLNAGLFHSAYIPPTSLHIHFELKVVSVLFGDDDKTFMAQTEGNFTPEQQVPAPTVVGSGKAKIITGDAGKSFAFPGGFNLHSFALAVPQLRISSFSGTEALIRYFAVNTGDVEIGNVSLFGFGLRHSLSQYTGPEFPVDLAAGFFWQTFSIGDDLMSCHAFSFGIQASKRLNTGLVSLEPYTGFSIDSYSMDVSYQSETTGSTVNIDLAYETERTAHLTFGLALDLTFLHLLGEYNIAGQQSFSFGLAVGY